MKVTATFEIGQENIVQDILDETNMNVLNDFAQLCYEHMVDYIEVNTPVGSITYSKAPSKSKAQKMKEANYG